MCDVPLSRSARRGAALLRYGNRAEITVLVCEEKLFFQYEFGAGAKATRHSVNITLEWKG